MKKLGVVISVAAVATLVGCKDPNYKGNSANSSRNEVKNVEVAEEPAAKPAAKPAPKPAKKVCLCAPGTKHTSPCACGADDCACVVVKPAPVKPAEPEYTLYIVQRGDYLAKISKKFNIRVDSIRKLNPSIKKDIVRVGQKIKLPGKVDVGVQSAPKVAVKAKTAASKKAFAAYKGETRDYTVKSGDTLGSIAYGNGINIRQLKELNKLSSDKLSVGQKLKIPAKGKVVESKPAEAVKAPRKPEATPAVAEKKVEKAPAAAEVEKPAEAAPAPVDTPVAAETVEPAPAAAAPATEEPVATSSYVVQEGDDMTGVAIRFGVTAATIRDLNNLPEDAQLTVGQVIKLPADAQQ
jgi:LysM repeat protein